MFLQGIFLKLLQLFFRSYNGNIVGNVFCINPRKSLISQLKCPCNRGSYLQSSPSLAGILICPAANQKLPGLISSPQLHHVYFPFDKICKVVTGTVVSRTELLFSWFSGAESVLEMTAHRVYFIHCILGVARTPDPLAKPV